jgi:hypothetical protein
MLEQAVSQLTLCSSPAAPQVTANSSSSSSSSNCCSQQHQQRLGVLAAFDLSLLRYRERDALLETFQRYRHKVWWIQAAAGGACTIAVNAKMN